MKVVTWNILHRIHEEKYRPDSKVLETFPDERNRVVAVIGEIHKCLETPDTVCCLQECSATVLTGIQRHIANNSRCLFYKKVKEAEYLVTITPQGFWEEEIEHHPDTAVGMLAVRRDECRVINCHLKPQRFCRYSVLDGLLSLPTEEVPLVVAGDLNEQPPAIQRVLGHKYGWVDAGNSYRKKQIDHVLYDKFQWTLTDGKIVDTGYTSDHRMVVADLSLRRPQKSFVAPK